MKKEFFLKFLDVRAVFWWSSKNLLKWPGCVRTEVALDKNKKNKLDLFLL